MKLIQTNRGLGHQMNKLYNVLLQDNCLQNTKIINNMLSIALIDSSRFGLSFYGMPRNSTTILANVILVRQNKLCHILDHQLNFNLIFIWTIKLEIIVMHISTHHITIVSQFFHQASS